MRAGIWALKTIPAGILILVLGVDVQKDRLALHLVGFGENERCATIDYVELPGDPEKQDVWNQLTEYRHQSFVNGFGVPLRVAMTAIDTGFNTHRVYNYARMYRHDRVMAVKGAKEVNRPILSRPTKQDVKNAKGDVQKNGVLLWSIGTDTAKNALFARLGGDMVVQDGIEELIPEADRMIRFAAGLEDEFYDQLAAEVYDDRSGRWVKVRARNEALDTWVYAYAAACHPYTRIHRMTPTEWERLRGMVEPAVRDLFSPSSQEKQAQTSAQLPAPLQVEVARPAKQETMVSGAPQNGYLDGTDNWL